MSYAVQGSGTHTLKWRYFKDVSFSAGSDCGWIKGVVWGPTPLGMVLAKAVDSLADVYDRRDRRQQQLGHRWGEPRRRQWQCQKRLHGRRPAILDADDRERAGDVQILVEGLFGK